MYTKNFMEENIRLLLKRPSVEKSIFSKYSLPKKPNNDCDGVSILVEADYHWKIVTGESEKITDRLTIVSTKL